MVVVVCEKRKIIKIIKKKKRYFSKIYCKIDNMMYSLLKSKFVK